VYSGRKAILVLLTADRTLHLFGNFPCVTFNTQLHTRKTGYQLLSYAANKTIPFLSRAFASLETTAIEMNIGAAQPPSLTQAAQTAFLKTTACPDKATSTTFLSFLCKYYG